MEEQVLNEFIEHLRLKGRKPETLLLYQRHIMLFGHYLNSLQIFSFFEAQEHHFTSYRAHLQASNNAYRTCHKKMHNISFFYRWLAEQGYILYSPYRYQSFTRNHTLPRKVPDTPVLRYAIKMLRCSDLYIEQRDSAIIDIGYSCGLRLSEICQLNIQDIRLQEGTLKIRGKGDKDRLVPVGTRTLEALLHYLYHIRPRFLKESATNALFVSWVKGGKRLSKVGISRMFNRIRTKYGLGKALHSHGLRHACATDLLRNGAPIQDVAKMLGHASMETTKIYTRLLPLHLKKHYNKYHPRG